MSPSGHRLVRHSSKHKPKQIEGRFKGQMFGCTCGGWLVGAQLNRAIVAHAAHVRSAKADEDLDRRSTDEADRMLAELG